MLLRIDDHEPAAERVFAACAARRRAIADFLDTLTEAQLATPSLCAGWDVRTVAGHLVVPLTVRAPQMALTILRHGGSFHRANTALARARAARPVGELTAVLRERATSRFTPPGKGPPAPLLDLCVHAADMRVPLGLDHDVTAAEAAAGLDLVTGSGKFFVPRGRLDGLQLVATDLDRSWGRGDVVRATAAHLLLAALARTPFLEHLTGPGASLLARRCQT